MLGTGQNLLAFSSWFLSNLDKSSGGDQGHSYSRQEKYQANNLSILILRTLRTDCFIRGNRGSTGQNSRQTGVKWPLCFSLIPGSLLNFSAPRFLHLWNGGTATYLNSCEDQIWPTLRLRDGWKALALSRPERGHWALHFETPASPLTTSFSLPSFQTQS